MQIENQLSDYRKILCGVPQGSTLRTIDVSQIKSNLFLSSIDSCLMYQHRDVEEIEKQLRKYFENIYDWFVDNRLSVNFREDKTKPIVFLSKCKIQSARKLNVKNKDIKINNTRR